MRMDFESDSFENANGESAIGFWVSKEKAYEYYGATPFHFIAENPSLFGITAQAIKDVHNAHAEMLGEEGYAQEKFVKEAIKNGWIFVQKDRRKGSENHWSVESSDSEAQADTIRAFLLLALEHKVIDLDSWIVIVGYDVANDRYVYKAENEGLKYFVLLEMGRDFQYISENSPFPKASENSSFWIKEDKIYDLAEDIHVKFLIDHPDPSSLTNRLIRNIYKRHDEVYGTKGKASEDLLKTAASKGWVQVRRYPRRSDRWSIQCDATKKRRDVIKRFIGWAVANKIMQKNDSAVMLGFDDPKDEIHFGWIDGGIKKYVLDSYWNWQT
jgi:hypothetical protein